MVDVCDPRAGAIINESSGPGETTNKYHVAAGQPLVTLPALDAATVLPPHDDACLSIRYNRP